MLSMCQQTASKHRCCYDIFRWRSNEQDDKYEVTQAVEYARSYVVNSRIAEGVKKKNTIPNISEPSGQAAIKPPVVKKTSKQPIK